MSTVLGIEVPPDLLRRWIGWVAPDPQPLFVASAREWPGTPGDRDGISAELADTYQLWRIPRALDVVWIGSGDFRDLPRRRRAALVREQVDHRREVPTVRGWADLLDRQELVTQADGHRFVWWPDLVAPKAEAVLTRLVTDDRLASRHREVPAATWRRCASVLPGARALAGTFPEQGGPNCFSTVLDAAGVRDSSAAWDATEPFDAWLHDATARGGSDDACGTVYVWRTNEGRTHHAAVGLGDGWALEKQSRDWHAPRAVVAVADLIRSNTYRGQRLERRRIT